MELFVFAWNNSLETWEIEQKNRTVPLCQDWSTWVSRTEPLSQLYHLTTPYLSPRQLSSLRSRRQCICLSTLPLQPQQPSPLHKYCCHQYSNPIRHSASSDSTSEFHSKSEYQPKSLIFSESRWLAYVSDANNCRNYATPIRCRILA